MDAANIQIPTGRILRHADGTACAGVVDIQLANLRVQADRAGRADIQAVAGDGARDVDPARAGVQVDAAAGAGENAVDGQAVIGGERQLPAIGRNLAHIQCANAVYADRAAGPGL